MSGLYEQQRKLVKTTLELLEARGNLTYDEIAAGAKVGIHWLHKFSQGHIDSPRIDRVQRVHDYLAGQKAKAAA